MSKILSLVKAIGRCEPLTTQERLVGIELALVYMWDKGYSRVRLGTLVERTGMTERTVSRALKGLVDKGIFERVRTGRATIYRLCGFSVGSKIVDSPLVASLMRQGWRIENMSFEEWHCREEDERAEEMAEGI